VQVTPKGTGIAAYQAIKEIGEPFPEKANLFATGE